MEDVAAMTATAGRSLDRYNAALIAPAYVSGQAKLTTLLEFTPAELQAEKRVLDFEALHTANAAALHKMKCDAAMLEGGGLSTSTPIYARAVHARAAGWAAGWAGCAVHRRPHGGPRLPPPPRARAARITRWIAQPPG